MINRSSAILTCLFFTSTLISQACPVLPDRPGRLTLKGMSEAIFTAESKGKFRLRLSSMASTRQSECGVINLKNHARMDFSVPSNFLHSNGIHELLKDMSVWKQIHSGRSFIMMPKQHVPWESSRHFALAVGEGAVFNIFLPWALSRYTTDWENTTTERWPFPGFQSIWHNLQNGWNYDGDNFHTNLFSHPYGGNIYFNSGRSNGYNFWESSAFAIAGSYIWETFMESNRPAINDWVNTGMNGAAFGEVLYRLSTLVTDNTARGSHRFWTEIAGGFINPVRLFTRLVTGEASLVFENPPWRKPEMLDISLNSGTRILFKENANNDPESKELQGIFELIINYGNPYEFRYSSPFSHFYYNIALASSYPSLTSMNIIGALFAIELSDNENSKQCIETTMNYNYINNPEFLYGSASVTENLNSYFRIKGDDAFRTKLGIKLIPMGGTPNDYFYDSINGRTYDFGQGIGWLGSVSYYDGDWEIFNVNYEMDFIWTQSQPSYSRHTLQSGSVMVQLPLRDYVVVGVDAGYYKRNSYYSYPQGYLGYNIPGKPETSAHDVYHSTPFLRVFLKTRLL